MKFCKYLLAGAIIFGATTPMLAQTDTKAVVDQVTQIIKAKGADYEKQVKQLYKDNKKDAETLVAIGKAFYNAKDYERANMFADYALQATKNKFAPAFLLKGDVCVSMDDAGGAAENYQQAKYFAPKDPEGYYKYAMILRGRSPQEAIDNLEELRKQLPDYPVDALAGRIYYTSNVQNRFEKAEQYFNRVSDISKMEDDDITKYAMTEFLLGKREKSIEVAKAGLQKDARRAGWNRLVFWNYTDLKDTQNALEYADRLFNKSDSAHITADDYAYYGTALQQAQRWEDAVNSFGKALSELKNDSGAIVSETVLLKNLSDVYNEKGDFDKSIEYFEKSIQSKKEQTLDDYDNLGALYANIASKKTQAGDAAGAAEAFKKADEVYGEMMQKFPNYANYGNYMRAQINANLDPDSKAGLAKPYYEKLASSLEAKAEKSNSELQMLKQAYFYLMVYEYNTLHDTAASKGWAAKLLVIDPENDVAKQVESLK